LFWKKRKREIEIAHRIKEEAAKIVEVLKGKWAYFNTAVPFRDDVSLADRIEAFVEPAREGILNNYPIMRTAPNDIIWEMVFVAVIESKTHRPDEVSQARAALAAKYAQF
jgi:hypothetical protein